MLAMAYLAMLLEAKRMWFFALQKKCVLNMQNEINVCRQHEQVKVAKLGVFVIEIFV